MEHIKVRLNGIKKLLTTILLLFSFLSLVSVYAYVIIAKIIIHPIALYNFDPKDLSISFMYEYTLVFYLIGGLIILLLFLFLMGEMVLKSIKTSHLRLTKTSILAVAVLVLYIISYIDPGNVLFWFFD